MKRKTLFSMHPSEKLLNLRPSNKRLQRQPQNQRAVNALPDRE